MEIQPKSSLEESARLQCCINDLISIQALGAAWNGKQSSEIVETLVDTLFSMLRLDVAAVRLIDPNSGDPVRAVRVAPNLKAQPEKIRDKLEQLLGNHQQTFSAPVTIRLEDRNISMVMSRLGIEGEIGTIIVGSQRAGFPLRTESLLLGVTANQASMALQESRLSERKRVVAELDTRGAQRIANIDNGKRAEEKLRQSQAFLADSQHLSQTGSFSWRVATDEITWSDELYRIYGLEIGLPATLELIRTRVHPEDLTLYEKMMEAARNGSHDFEWHYRLLMPDQSIKYLHAVAHATSDQDGQLEYIAAIQDVTARHLSEEARDQARSEFAHVARAMSLGTLTASIAHELNQPLSGIVTNASTCMRMLASDPPNIEGARETARRTIRDGNRASEVITRLRALFSKKDATSEPVDLNDAVREVIALSSTELQRSQVTLRCELADDLPVATGDRIQLQQVILNLLRNASDAMISVDDRPRELLISTQRDDGDQLRFSIKDAGVGFDPQGLERLFDTFYTTKNGGMGIGLSVSRSIVESHHGRLWACLNDGPGATFSFSIPCRSDASIAAKGSVQAPSATEAA